MPYIYQFVMGRVGGADESLEGDTSTGIAAGGGAKRSIKSSDKKTAGVILFILAITTQNMPEGLADRVAFGSANLGNALAPMLLLRVEEVRALDGVTTVEDQEGASHALGNPLAGSIFVTSVE